MSACCFPMEREKSRNGCFKLSGISSNASAGDYFVNGILNILASFPNLYKDEILLREALLFANAFCAIIVTEREAIPALPSKEAILQIRSKVSTTLRNA